MKDIISPSILDYLVFDCPTTEQVDVLNAMQTFVGAENDEDFMILCGAAGTGKTSITSALIGFHSLLLAFHFLQKEFIFSI